VDEFNKLKIASRYWLHGIAQEKPEYYAVLRAFEIAEAVHDGTRKGGQPEFIHQLQIFSHLRTQHAHLLFPVETYAAAFLHDTLEDKADRVSEHELVDFVGQRVVEAVRTLSKELYGEKKEPHFYFATVSMCPIASVVKLADRVNNVGSMVGVFSREKMEAYVKESREHFPPLIKLARRHFHQQEPIYENFKLTLNEQLDLIDVLLQQSRPTWHCPPNEQTS
jgi:(p)ppGpp synthase/HD superfamily hydrolase